MAVNSEGRLPLLQPEQLAGRSSELCERLIDWVVGSPFRTTTDAGELIGPFNACLYSPEIGEAFLAFHEAERGATPLSKRVREIVILSVGAVWRSDYELYAHRAVAAHMGMPTEMIDALAAGRECDELAADEKAAQRFALELTRGRRVSDATYASAERAFGREGVVAMTFLAGLYGLTSALLNAFDVPAAATG